MPLGSRSELPAVVERLPVAMPYRLDLTVAVLRRSVRNVVDVVTEDGAYLRAFDGALGPSVAVVRQMLPHEIELTIAGPPGEAARVRALVIRMLGVDRATPHFDAAAAAIPWLAALAARMRGVKPPRYPTLWEAAVNAVSFQQISIIAAGAIVRRCLIAFGVAVDPNAIVAVAPGDAPLPVLHAFPPPEVFAGADEAALRATGQSAGKVATLRRVAEALLTGALDEAMLRERPTREAIALLAQIKGIGPWTGTVMMMRALGRLDVFPERDSGLARSLRIASGSAIDEAAASAIVASLAPEQAMLYFHLLLAILEARGDLPGAAQSRGNGVQPAGGSS